MSFIPLIRLEKYFWANLYDNEKKTAIHNILLLWALHLYRCNVLTIKGFFLKKANENANKIKILYDYDFYNTFFMLTEVCNSVGISVVDLVPDPWFEVENGSSMDLGSNKDGQEKRVEKFFKMNFCIFS